MDSILFFEYYWLGEAFTNKEEPELIILCVEADGDEARHMKIYKNDIHCRKGVGGLPRIGICGMSFTGKSNLLCTSDAMGITRNTVLTINL